MYERRDSFFCHDPSNSCNEDLDQVVHCDSGHTHWQQVEVSVVGLEREKGREKEGATVPNWGVGACS